MLTSVWNRGEAQAKWRRITPLANGTPVQREELELAGLHAEHHSIGLLRFKWRRATPREDDRVQVIRHANVGDYPFDGEIEVDFHKPVRHLPVWTQFVRAESPVADDRKTFTKRVAERFHAFGLPVQHTIASAVSLERDAHRRVGSRHERMRHDKFFRGDANHPSVDPLQFEIDR